MSNQNQNSNENKTNVVNNNDVKKIVNTGGGTNSQGKSGSNVQNDLSSFAEFCRRNVRYLAAAGLFLVIVFLLVKGSAGSSGGTKDNKNNVAAASTETPAKAPETEASSETQDFAKDAYPQINELISNYYTAYANGDLDTLAALTQNMTETEKSYISVFSQQVAQYENISCYTKSGLDDTSYIVSVCLDMRFNDIETTAPGLEFFYVRTNPDGSLYIDQRYSQFNLTKHEVALEPEVEALIEDFKQQEDVIALQNQVQTKYTEAIAADESLRVMAETTVPDVIKVWASDQAEAAKAAEEAAKAEEEAAKKAAEEEAAKKAEEEKKAAELAAAVTVFATSKVNVRAQASEEADIIGQLEAGSQTTRLEDKDGWSRIDYSNGTQGYVKSEYLSTDSNAVASNDTAEAAPAEAGGLAEGSTVTLKESVSVRESMSTDSAKVATAYAGEKVIIVMSYAEGWTKVNYNDKIGFIRTDLLQ